MAAMISPGMSRCQPGLRGRQEQPWPCSVRPVQRVLQGRQVPWGGWLAILFILDGVKIFAFHSDNEAKRNQHGEHQRNAGQNHSAVSGFKGEQSDRLLIGRSSFSLRCTAPLIFPRTRYKNRAANFTQVWFYYNTAAQFLVAGFEKM